MSPISLAFKNCKKEKRPALITFTVAGDNSKKNSLKILNSIARYADILELSFLHNCPIADGGQIQNSTYRSLENGTTLKDTFQIAKKFKNINPNKPLILMGYYNLIYQNGENNFLKNCKLSKVDGLIVVDLPWPENKKFAEKCNYNFLTGSLSFGSLKAYIRSMIGYKTNVRTETRNAYMRSIMRTVEDTVKGLDGFDA